MRQPPDDSTHTSVWSRLTNSASDACTSSFSRSGEMLVVPAARLGTAQAASDKALHDHRIRILFGISRSDDCKLLSGNGAG
jgi:hypothetical protein